MLPLSGIVMFPGFTTAEEPPVDARVSVTGAPGVELLGVAVKLVMVGGAFTVTVAEPDGVPLQDAFETDTIVYVVVATGETGRMKGLRVTLLSTWPSDQTIVHGPLPVKFTLRFAVPFGQIVVEPVTAAVGGTKIGMLLDAFAVQVPSVPTTERPTVPVAPAVNVTVAVF